MPNELTNPNNVVTEERLAQFYQQILPYMGGMPDILANKFSKADLYSTDEKLIGRWIDGKPIYSKVVTGIGDTYQNWDQVVLSSDVNVNQIIDAKIITSDRVGIDGGGFTSLVATVVESTGDVKLYNAISHTNANTAYAIQYTKTTDSAVEIGDDTDYSTTEKIVGTWIDGKPIWQKTVEATTPNKATIKYTPVGANIETVVNYVAMFKNTPSTTGLNNWIKAGSLASQLENLSSGLVVHVYGNDATAGTPNSVVIRHNADGWGGKPLYVTIQYTKTSS